MNPAVTFGVYTTSVFCKTCLGFVGIFMLIGCEFLGGCLAAEVLRQLRRPEDYEDTDVASKMAPLGTQYPAMVEGQMPPSVSPPLAAPMSIQGMPMQQPGKLDPYRNAPLDSGSFGTGPPAQQTPGSSLTGFPRQQQQFIPMDSERSQMPSSIAPGQPYSSMPPEHPLRPGSPGIGAPTQQFGSQSQGSLQQPGSFGSLQQPGIIDHSTAIGSPTQQFGSQSFGGLPVPGTGSPTQRFAAPAQQWEPPSRLGSGNYQLPGTRSPTQQYSPVQSAGSIEGSGQWNISGQLRRTNAGF